MGCVQSTFRFLWHTVLRGCQHIRGFKSTASSPSPTPPSSPPTPGMLNSTSSSDSSQTKCTPSITFSTASHRARPFPNIQDMSSLEFLKEACPDVHTYTRDILHSSMPSVPFTDVKPQRNGFVHTVLECYNEHRALIVRPDDVWLAIMTQFSCFVNGNAEAMRSLFVLHEGKKELSMIIHQTPGEENWDLVVNALVENMNKQIQQNVIDPELRQWIIPDFSTTTPLDHLVSGMVMMATVKEYFTFRLMLMCGIPRVTLEGEKSDWTYILNRLEKLKEFGPKTNAWYRLLRPILLRFIKAFDHPDSKENLDFWSQLAHYEGFGSGPTWLSGWITAFMVFDEKGMWTPDKSHQNSELIIDDVLYPLLDSDEIPAGYAQVDVTLQREIGGVEHPTSLVGGMVGTRICSSGDKALSDTGERDSARPALAWWWVMKKDPPAEEESSDLPVVHGFDDDGDE